MGHFVGIDLGTTMSSLAYLNGVGEPEIVPNSEGERLTPSVVCIQGGDKRIVEVGEGAKNAGGSEPDRVISGVKRLMGEESQAVTLDGKPATIDGKDYSPEEISAFILKKLAGDAALKLEEIDEVVITVPAYFAEQHRKATMDAGKIAGLKVKAIINEPTAAAIFYATQQEISGNIVVYDLGAELSMSPLQRLTVRTSKLSAPAVIAS